jgi:PHD/YefM family antitoxin component YafN of YafNO toxin-antitoxin module
MKVKAILSILILLTACTNGFHGDEIQKIKNINDVIASKYSCRMTVDIVKEKDKRLELSIEKINNTDDLLLGKIFIDYYKKIKATDLKFQRYVLKENNKAIYTITQEHADLLLEKIESYKSLVDQLQTDKNNLYKLLDENLKNNMSFDDFNTQMSKLYLGEMVFCGFVYNDTLMSLGFENNQNRLLLISNPKSEEKEILGIQIQ